MPTEKLFRSDATAIVATRELFYYTMISKSIFLNGLNGALQRMQPSHFGWINFSKKIIVWEYYELKSGAWLVWVQMHPQSFRKIDLEPNLELINAFS